MINQELFDKLLVEVTQNKVPQLSQVNNNGVIEILFQTNPMLNKTLIATKSDSKWECQEVNMLDNHISNLIVNEGYTNAADDTRLIRFKTTDSNKDKEKSYPTKFTGNPVINRTLEWYLQLMT